MPDNSTSPDDDGLELTLRPLAGLIGDVRRRLPFYADDFRQGLHSKVVASTLFLFFACLANAVAFGALTSLVTDGQIGTVEMIVATAAGGIVFALFSGQPLTILGGTGPIVIFTGLLYTACRQAGLDFLAVYAWVGLWSALFMVLFALFNTSALMRYFTRFTDEIFATLIAVIFIVEATRGIIEPFLHSEWPKSTALLTLVLGIGTFAFARALKSFAHTPYLSNRVRQFISDFGPAIAIALMTAFAMFEEGVVVDRAVVPDQVSTTSGRPWLVDLFAIPTWAIFACAGPALMATILLFLDQNITTRLVNARSHMLRKGPGFHLDLLVVGLITGTCSLFGLPWIVAATVHSLNHVRSLATLEVVGHGEHRREAITSVRENRISPLCIHLLIGASLLSLPLIKLVPIPVLLGLFLFMGFATLAGNQFFERMRLWVTDSNLYPSTHFVRVVPGRTIHRFTLIQLACLGALWVLKASVVGIFFPVLIALLVPLRMLLPRWFDEAHLSALDADHEADVSEREPMAADVHA